ncbi:MAG: methyltransferase domain-containing protein [Wenzhouxiangellaceae bacterium]
MPADTSIWNRYWQADRGAACQADDRGLYTGVVARAWRAFANQLHAGSRVLDLATGNGAVAELLVESLRSGQTPVTIVGIDRAVIHPRLPASPKPGVECRWYANTPVETLPFAANMFHAVTSQYGVEYGDLERAVEEAARVLRPGGHLQWICHARSGHLARDAHEEAIRARSLMSLQLPGKVANLVRVQICNGSFIAGSHRVTAGTPEARSVSSGLQEGFRISGSRPGAPNGNLGLFIHNLAHLYQHRESHPVDLVLDKLNELEEEIQVHAGRLEALYAAALDADRIRLLEAKLEAAGLEIGTGPEHLESDSGRIVGIRFTARKPA